MTLGGALFIRNGETFDYCYREAIACLQELCDSIVILDAGSDDGTTEIVKQYEDQNTIVVCLDKEEWEKQKGKEKLSYFQNLAKSFLSTDYYILLQGDEIIHEACFPAIKRAIETGNESYLISRVNLWRDCNSYIVVSGDKQPCSTQIIRLAKLKYNSVDDGESIEAPTSDEFVNYIVAFHYGFVRKKEVMKRKIINMQESVFQLGFHDPKLDQSETFDSDLWFKGDDLKPLAGEHPKFIKEWVKTRP